jgi:ABC-type transport system involved in cytochrome bd biosynthesis fused ATPase/permease subunit
MPKEKTVVMVTHAIKFAHYADKIILMRKGKVVAEGDYETISKMKEFTEI